MKHFKGENPLFGDAVLDIEIPDLEKAFGSGKVRESFWLSDHTLLLIDTDRIGAYDQPHRTVDGRPAFYTGKGKIINAFNQMGEKIASSIMPTDYVKSTNEHWRQIPRELWPRCSFHFPAEKRIDVEAIARTVCEGSMAKTAKEGKLLCGQSIPADLFKGDALEWPMFTPTSKASKGEKDMPITLEEYFQVIGDKAVANYIYGMSILLHLAFRGKALDNHLDHPDGKFEFGLFPAGLPICGTPQKDERGKILTYDRLFRRLCSSAGFLREAWEKMPDFDFELFCQFAEENAKTGIVRLIDERVSTDSGRFRLWANTSMGRDLMQQGCVEQARFLLDDFLCKEWFRAQSRLTGKGGYDADAKQIVTLEDWVLAETGRRNLMAYLWMYGE
jgi:phosphoribosylaminoimidazole-succinocarboxamide synthase